MSSATRWCSPTRPPSGSPPGFWFNYSTSTPRSIRTTLRARNRPMAPAHLRGSRPDLLEGVVEGNQPLLQPINGGLGPIRQVELREDVRHVRLDRLLPDRQVLGDFLIGVAAREGREDVDLAGRELIDGIAITATAHLVQQLGGDAGIQHTFSASGSAHRADDRLDACRLEYV